MIGNTRIERAKNAARFAFGYVAWTIICRTPLPDTSWLWWALLPHAGLYANWNWYVKRDRRAKQGKRHG